MTLRACVLPNKQLIAETRQRPANFARESRDYWVLCPAHLMRPLCQLTANLTESLATAPRLPKGRCAAAQLHVRSSTVHGKHHVAVRGVPLESSTYGARSSHMASTVALQERDVRQVLYAAVKTALGVPQHSWSADFVLEAVLGELVSTRSSNAAALDTNTSASDANDATMNSHSEGNGWTGSRAAVPAGNSSAAAPGPKSSRKSSKDSSSNGSSNKGSRNSTKHIPSPAEVSSEVVLLPELAEAVDGYSAAAGNTEPGSSKTRSRTSSSSRHRKSDSESEEEQQRQQQHQDEAIDLLQSRFSQLLYDNFQEVEDDDVKAFCHKLLAELLHLVQQAEQDQSEDVQGLCALCGRDMPLTKHHLIPRDVHKEFKKRGFNFDQLQSGLMVCRPCHSAIHRAVPDNKELATHYRTLDALQQHEAVAKFSAWASKQRVSSKADAGTRHFRYRR